MRVKVPDVLVVAHRRAFVEPTRRVCAEGGFGGLDVLACAKDLHDLLDLALGVPGRDCVVETLSEAVHVLCERGIDASSFQFFRIWRQTDAFGVKQTHLASNRKN